MKKHLLKKIFRLKTLVISLVLIIFSILFLELLSPVFYRLVNKAPFSKEELQTRLFANITNITNLDVFQDQLPSWVNKKDLHPYVGFTNRKSNFNKYGFTGLNPLLKKSPDRINICILGGSFAASLYNKSRKTFMKHLKNTNYFSNKEIVITSMAIGGYKQPQQLFALLLFLFLGAEYDMVINIDGFNEIALPFTENIPHQIFPYFPRSWYLYTTKSLNIKAILQIAKIYKLKENQQKLKKKFSKFPLYHSNFLLLLWNSLDIRAEDNIRQANIKLKEILTQKNWQEFGAVSSSFNMQNKAIFSNLVKYWKNSSFQIHNLSQANHFIYFHALQPNQYYPGSKFFSQKEKMEAYVQGDYIYKEAVINGYPLLVEAGKNLLRNGLNFIDLTMIFKNNKQTIYIDNCCHLNKKGYDLIVKELAKEIIKYYQENINK